MAKVISVTTQKGGVLKSSIVTNLAGILSKEGNKVLIIDTDPQGSASISFAINPDHFENTLYDTLIGEVSPDKVIKNIYENIDILPANDDMAFFEIDIISRKGNLDSLYLLKSLVNKLDPFYDIILLDCPPNFGLTLGNILIASQELILPFQPEPYSMRSLQKIIKKIEEFKEEHNPSLRISGVVGTLIDKRTKLHTEVLQECEKYCNEKGIRMFNTKIPRSVQFANSIAYDRKPITLTSSSKNRFTKVYSALCKEVFSNGSE
jgi:chromosome partitioning protein